MSLAMLEAARSACLAALMAVEAAIEAHDSAPDKPAPLGAEDFSSLTFEDQPAPKTTAPIRRKLNGKG